MTPCPLCRTEIDNEQPRCPSCGARVKHAAAVPPPSWGGPGAAALAPAYAATAPGAPVPGAALPPPRSLPPLPPLRPVAAHSRVTPPVPPVVPWMAPVAVPRKRSVGKVLAVIAGVLGSIFGVLVLIGIVAGEVDDNRANDKIARFVDGEGGTEFTSAGDGFTAKFPTRPLPTEQTESTPSGPVVFHNNVSHPGRQYVFEVGYWDFGTIQFPPGRATLAGFASVIAGELDGEVTQSAPADLDGEVAEQFTVEFEQDGVEAKAIASIAVHGPRVYMVAVTAPNLQRDAFETFVSTFEFTDGAAS